MKDQTVGSSGMVSIDYKGLNYGKETFYGPVSGVPYTFSARAFRKWVDRRDLRFDTPGGASIGLLDLMENGKPLFERSPKVEVEVQTEAETADAENLVVEEVQSEELGLYVLGLTEVSGIGMKTAEDLVAAGFLMPEHIIESSSEEMQEQLGWSPSRATSVKTAVEKYVNAIIE